MKKIKLLKAMLFLFVAVSFTNCEEDGAIQFVVVDEFESNAVVTGLNTATSFETSSSTDISELLENAGSFVEADIETVTFTLQDDFSGDAIVGDFNLSVGPLSISRTLTLSKGVPAVVEIPVAASNILSVINSGFFPYTVGADFTQSPADDNFTINLKFKVRATVE